MRVIKLNGRPSYILIRNPRYRIDSQYHLTLVDTGIDETKTVIHINEIKQDLLNFLENHQKKGYVFDFVAGSIAIVHEEMEYVTWLVVNHDKAVEIAVWKESIAKLIEELKKIW